jgi:hypothetical protein
LESSTHYFPLFAAAANQIPFSRAIFGIGSFQLVGFAPASPFSGLVWSEDSSVCIVSYRILHDLTGLENLTGWINEMALRME